MCFVPCTWLTSASLATSVGLQGRDINYLLTYKSTEGAAINTSLVVSYRCPASKGDELNFSYGSGLSFPGKEFKARQVAILRLVHFQRFRTVGSAVKE